MRTIRSLVPALVLALLGGTGLAAATPHVYLVTEVITGKMYGRPGWPRYNPAAIVVPAHALVTLTILNFDDGTAPLPANSPYLEVRGALGPAFISRFMGRASDTEATSGKAEYRPDLSGTALKELLALQQEGHFTALPGELASHTFTVAALGLNIPIPPLSVVTVTFRTGAPGHYIWQCETPCGTGPNGMGGPMVTPGYMMGSFVVE
jgi:hypothetical protein